MTTLYYNEFRRLDEMSTQALTQEIEQASSERRPVSPKRVGRPKKSVAVVSNKENTMEQETVEQEALKTKRVQRTVFDLKAFDNVLLVKDVPLPPKPGSVDEAIQYVNRDTERLLNLIYQGLVSEATSKAYDDISGFHFYNEDAENETGAVYDGTFANEDQGKKINAAILVLAKLRGYDKSMTPDKKSALKKEAADFLRANPAMLQSV